MNTEYLKGHHALEIFTMEATPLWVKIWIFASTAWFALGLFFVWKHALARWVVGCYLAGFGAMVVAVSMSSSVLLRLSGFNALMHVVFWSPALYQLLAKRPFFAKDVTVFSIWAGVIAAIMLFSYVFDIPYSFIYLKYVLYR